MNSQNSLETQPENGTSSTPIVPKIEPTSSRYSRLPSFRTNPNSPGSSILMPGASAPKIKKEFVPNLVKRNKHKGSLSVGRSEQNRNARGKDGNSGQRGRGRGRGRGGREFIQSAGLWTAGGSSTAPSGSGLSGLSRGRGGVGGFSSFRGFGGGGGGGGRGGGRGSLKASESVMQMPVIANGDMAVDTENDKEVIAQLREGDCDYYAENDSADFYSNYCQPTGLDDYKGVKKEILKKPDDVITDIKKEPGEEEQTATTNGFEPKNDVMESFMDVPSTREQEVVQPNITEVFSQSKGVFFVQLPNTLPSIVSANASERDKAENTEQNVDSGRNSEFCLLRNLPTGQIGSLKVYKSGKASLCLGKYSLPVELIKPPTHLEEVVHTEMSDERRGKMAVMSQIQHRLVVKPDFSNLLDSLKL